MSVWLIIMAGLSVDQRKLHEHNLVKRYR